MDQFDVRGARAKRKFCRGRTMKRRERRAPAFLHAGAVTERASIPGLLPLALSFNRTSVNPLPIFIALVFALADPVRIRAQGAAAPTNRPHPQSMKLLRETIADQTRNPGKVIRTYTNLPPQHAQLVSPVAVTPAEVPVFRPDPPRTEPLSPKAATAAVLERQFLEGRLSSRQYRKALADLERANSPSGEATAKSKSPAVANAPKSSRGAPAAMEPANVKAPPPPTARQQKVSEVESKIDEMIRQKEARERAAQTNSVPAPLNSQHSTLNYLPPHS